MNHKDKCVDLSKLISMVKNQKSKGPGIAQVFLITSTRTRNILNKLIINIDKCVYCGENHEQEHFKSKDTSKRRSLNTNNYGN